MNTSSTKNRKPSGKSIVSIRRKFEEEHRSEKMESLQEQITKNSYELEKLQRENERLKAERKTSKATGMQSFLTSKWTGYGAE